MNDLLTATSRARTMDRARTAALGVAGACVLAAGGVSLQGLREAAAIEECQRSGDAIRDTWGQDQRRRVVAAISIPAAPFAADVEARVLDGIDEYTESWAAARMDACVAGEVHGDISADDEVRRASCLDDRRRALASTIDLLGEPAEGLVVRAVQAVHELPDLGVCADPKWLATQASLIGDLDENAAADIRARIDHAMRLGLLGRYRDAHRDALGLARPMMNEVSEDDAPALAAEVRLMAGRTLGKMGKYDEAVSMLEVAADLALSAGHDDAAIIATTKLAFIEGHERENRDEGLRVARLALALARRFGRRGTPLEADALDTLGSVHFRRGEFDDAKRAFTAAIGVSGSSTGEVSSGRATSLMNLGNALLLAGEFEQFLESLPPGSVTPAGGLGMGGLLPPVQFHDGPGIKLSQSCTHLSVEDLVTWVAWASPWLASRGKQEQDPRALVHGLLSVAFIDSGCPIDVDALYVGPRPLKELIAEADEIAFATLRAGGPWPPQGSEDPTPLEQAAAKLIGRTLGRHDAPGFAYRGYAVYVTSLAVGYRWVAYRRGRTPGKSPDLDGNQLTPQVAINAAKDAIANALA